MGAFGPIAGGILGTGINAISTAIQNKKNREFAEQQRQKQYQTQVDFWRMNNEYNHPSAQMARLREGKLNPHLVYGTGTVVGNSSSAPNAPQQAKWQGEAPQVNPAMAGNMLADFTNIKAKQAQTDNLREQNTLYKQQQELNRIGILQKMLDYNIDATTQKAIVEKVITSLDLMRSQISKTDQDVVKSKDDMANNRMRTWSDVRRTEVGVLDSDMKRKFQEAGVAESVLRRKKLKIETAIKKVHYKLWEDNISPNDPMAVRVIAGYLQETLGGSIKVQGTSAWKNIAMEIIKSIQ